MFTETAGSRKAIGDVDILFHEGLYHLFHLVLPNHDFIAHAVSTDGIHWRRVRNAIFIGDPGSWDDLMLWTMHVSPDPHQEGRWRMFYTGLSRRERGDFQRIGLALSDDLYRWEKYPVHWRDERGPHDPDLVQKAREASRHQEPNDTTALFDEDSCHPISPDPRYYEASLDEGRHLVSFRDPFFTGCGGKNHLLVAARANSGPTVRRGCVAMLEETSPNCFESRPPLHYPRLYDDIEVPNLIEIGDQFYLIGSIREDAKIRYWHAPDLETPWKSFHDNVLMPQGNYAGRVCRDENGWLLWCFFAMNRADRTADNLMPPPKRLACDENGLLHMKTFEALDDWCREQVEIPSLRALKTDVESSSVRNENGTWVIESKDEFQMFVCEEKLESFRLQARLDLDGRGKCGLVFRIDPESHDGYYLSLDLLKGVAQLRAWGTDHEKTGEHMMSFETLQSNFWFAKQTGAADVCLIAFGSYLEFSINGKIVLSLADRRFTRGHVGVYLETARLDVEDLEIFRMKNPDQFDDHLVGG